MNLHPHLPQLDILRVGPIQHKSRGPEQQGVGGSPQAELQPACDLATATGSARSGRGPAWSERAGLRRGRRVRRVPYPCAT